MRTLILLAAVASLAFAGCAMHEKPIVESAGEAYEEVNNISELNVLPIDVPDTIEGEATAEERERWKEAWPLDAAHYVAEEIQESTDSRVRTTVVGEPPRLEYYLDMKITHLDVGDADERAGNLIEPVEEGYSRVKTEGQIINAQTGEVVAELKVESGSYYDWELAFENDMRDIGEKIGDWLTKRKE